MSSSEAVGMSCPSCHQPPAFAFPTQAFCGNDDCPLFTWNPLLTMDELLDDMGVVDLSGLPGQRVARDG